MAAWPGERGGGKVVVNAVRRGGGEDVAMSAVLLRQPREGDATILRPEDVVVVADALKHPDGKLSPLKWSSARYGMVAPPRDLAKPSNEWNSARIIVRGKQVEHWLNGELAAKFEIGSEDWQARVQKGKWKAYPRYALETKGRFCLQDHGHTVAFRNVKILPLTASAN